MALRRKTFEETFSESETKKDFAPDAPDIQLAPGQSS